MFYCEKCRKEKHWPTGMLNSYGHCEVCGEIADCYDRLSGLLPSSLEEAINLEELFAKKEELWEKHLSQKQLKVSI